MVTLYQWSRPRDLGHYERFGYDHATFGMRVEGLTTTPFSSRAIDRGLSAVVAAAVRQADTSSLPNGAAATVTLGSATAQWLLQLFSTRAERVTHEVGVAEHVRKAVQYRLDQWFHRRTHLPSGSMGYEKAADVTGLIARPEDGTWNTWTAPMSLREVEPEVLLQIDRRGAGADDEPGWSYDRQVSP